MAGRTSVVLAQSLHCLLHGKKSEGEKPKREQQNPLLGVASAQAKTLDRHSRGSSISGVYLGYGQQRNRDKHLNF